MELRTRFLPKLLNCEVEEYLAQNDLIFIPVGSVEMHGGMPLECETALSEAAALLMAQQSDGLVLPGLAYFYAGATAIGRGTTQVSVQQGTAYLAAIADSLLRQGFRRQIYLSLHGPAHLTCSPMVRDFFDRTGAPALYIDLMLQLDRLGKDLLAEHSSLAEKLDLLILGAYRLLGRLDEIPLGDRFAAQPPSTVSPFSPLFSAAYQSGAVGYCFGAPADHMPTIPLPDPAHRELIAQEGETALRELVLRIDPAALAAQLTALGEFAGRVRKEYPWSAR
ncbi:MAG TPA: creatininase family protein [Candidatus Pygmaiobacter gallistercoris]|nr:creatininase family protein [Candidatus Pygmaiobacter gallistercoris]